MDIFNLIRAVRCREPIWNRQHPQYKDRECSLMLWTEVGNETGVDVETARCKWRGLRDTFRVQLRKLNQSVKNGTANPLTWEYFDEMVFVKDQIYIDINRRKYYTKDRSIGDVTKANDDTKFKNEEEDDSKSEGVDLSRNKREPSVAVGSILQRVDYPMQTAIEHAIRLRMEQPTPAPEYISHLQYSTPTSTRCPVQHVRDYSMEEESEYQVPANFCVAEVTEDTETRLEFDSETNDGEQISPRSDEGEYSLIDRSMTTPLLQKKLKALQDDNYCFLMSILPQLKTLPTKQKLFVRIKIQELLYAEIMNMENHPD